MSSLGLVMFGIVRMCTLTVSQSPEGVPLCILRNSITAPATPLLDTLQVEYDLDSTRGRKHIFSTCAIAKNKLYIVNGTAKCESEDSCQAVESDIASLQEAAGSFDVLA